MVKNPLMTRFIYIYVGLVWIAAVMVGSPMLFVQQLEVSAVTKELIKEPRAAT